MYNYAKKKLEIEIDELKNKYNLEEEKEKEYYEKLNQLLDFKSLKKKRNDAKCNFVISFPIGIAFIVTIFNASNTFMTVLSILGTTISVGYSSFFIYKFKNITKNIEKNYKDFLDLSDEKFTKETELLNKKRNQIYKEKLSIDKKINQKYTNLEDIIMLDKYSEIALKNKNNPYYKADSEEEYKMLLSKKEECLNIFKDFSKDKFRYNIDLNSNTEYNQEDKKLIKHL